MRYGGGVDGMTLSGLRGLRIERALAKVELELVEDALLCPLNPTGPCPYEATEDCAEDADIVRAISGR
jgi:hypothetical protein